MISLLALASGPLAADKETLTVADPRPVSEAIDILASRYGWLVTYEDPPYLNSGDIAPGLHVPLGGRLDITYSVSPTTRLPDKREVIHTLLDAARQRTGIAFELREGVGRLHIVPAKAKDASGNPVDVTPVLDTRITIADEDTVAAGALSLICGAVTRMTGQRVTVGTTPLGFLRVRTHIGAEDKPAREVLSSVLDSVSPDLSWSLYYDPGDHSYALNIDVVQKAAAGSGAKATK